MWGHYTVLHFVYQLAAHSRVVESGNLFVTDLEFHVSSEISSCCLQMIGFLLWDMLFILYFSFLFYVNGRFFNRRALKKKQTSALRFLPAWSQGAPKGLALLLLLLLLLTLRCAILFGMNLTIF
jgi:hypothetical protein